MPQFSRRRSLPVARYYMREDRRLRASQRPNAGPSQEVEDDGDPQVFTMAGSVPAGGTVKWVAVNATGEAEAVIDDDDALDTDVTVTGIGRVTMRLISNLGHNHIVSDQTTLTVLDAEE
jgi:hypothetical protein